MEKRSILAILICTVLFFVWIEVVSPWIWPPVVPKENPVPQEVLAPSQPPVVVGQDPVKTPTTEPPTVVAQSIYPLRKETLRSPFLVLNFTSRGAGVESVQVHVQGQQPTELLGSILPDRPHFALRIPQSPVDLAQVNWDVKYEGAKPNTITFEYVSEEKWKVSKVFSLDDQKHVLKLLVEFVSLKGTQELRPEFYPFNGINHDSDYRYEDYCQGFVGMKKSDSWSVEYVSTSSVASEPKVIAEPRRDWVGLKNRYYAVAMIPDGERELRALQEYRFLGLPGEVLASQNAQKNILTVFPFNSILVREQPEIFKFDFYFGPIRQGELSRASRGLTNLYDPSGFDFVAAMILWVLNLGFSLFKNYGVAILFTTIVIRLCLFYLSKKSQVSMYRIQQLGPKLALLRERYKDDRERFGQEQMKLFREQKINPMSGCLPMLLQLPIFMGMYGVLDSAFDLRQSPFDGKWIKDLSIPDHLLGPWPPLEVLFITINAFNLLPIIMTITWFLQSYFAPRSEDPQMRAQQKMMMFMPVFFGIMCYNLASGLSFYFFVNSLLSMAETKIIKTFFIPKVAAKT